jgi:hypothetical protein
MSLAPESYPQDCWFNRKYASKVSGRRGELAFSKLEHTGGGRLDRLNFGPLGKVIALLPRRKLSDHLALPSPLLVVH